MKGEIQITDTEIINIFNKEWKIRKLVGSKLFETIIKEKLDKVYDRFCFLEERIKILEKNSGKK